MNALVNARRRPVSESSIKLAASALKYVGDEFKIGDRTTCQLGNPGDTDWTDATHANVPVIIIDKQRCHITFKMYYLVAKVSDPEFVGRASDSRHNDSIQGDTYCTNARRFGSKAQTWTGITTFLGAADSLGFTLPIYDGTFTEPKLTNAVVYEGALKYLNDHFEALITNEAGNTPAQDLFKHDLDEKKVIVRRSWDWA